MADTCNLALYEDKTFPLPDNFYDDYEGRPAAAAQEMSIVKDMDLIYDLKMLRPDKNSILKATYESFLGRMDKAQRAAWDKFYDPIIKDFYKQNLSGKELANWKYQRYMRDYMKTVKSLDDNVGRVLDYLEKTDCWKTRWLSTLPTKGSIWASTDGSTNASCMKSQCIPR